MAHHFHLLVWSRGVALASFMEYLRANLSKKVGRLVDWRGGFWERRYSAEPVLDDTALVGRLRYVLALGGDFSASFPLFSFPPRVVPGRFTRIL